MQEFIQDHNREDPKKKMADAVKQGYLEKRSADQGWKRRYFVLKGVRNVNLCLIIIIYLFFKQNFNSLLRNRRNCTILKPSLSRRSRGSSI